MTNIRIFATVSTTAAVTAVLTAALMLSRPARAGGSDDIDIAGVSGEASPRASIDALEAGPGTPRTAECKVFSDPRVLKTAIPEWMDEQLQTGRSNFVPPAPYWLCAW